MIEKKSDFLSKFFQWLSVPIKAQKSFLARLIVFFVIITATIAIVPSQIMEDIAVNKPAAKTLICPRDFEVTDRKETEALRIKAKDEVSNIYEINHSVNKQILDDFDKNAKILVNFYDSINDKNNKRKIKDIVKEMIPGNYILESKELEKFYGMTSSELDSLIENAKNRLIELSRKLITEKNIDEIKRELRATIESEWDVQPITRHLLYSMLKSSIRPNAFFNEVETLRRKAEAADSVMPVTKRYQKGQKIITEGEIVTEDVFEIYKEIQNESKISGISMLFGSLILSFIFIGLSIVYIRTHDTNVFVDDAQYKLLATLCFVYLLATKVVYGISNDFDNRFYLMVLLSPMATFVLLLNSTMSNLKIVYFIVFWMGLLSFVVTLGSESFIVGLMISLVTGAIGGVILWDVVYKDKEGDMRSYIIKTGSNIGVVTMFSILAVLLIDSKISTIYGYKTMFWYVICGLLNGFVSGIVTNGLLPYIEEYFSFATPTKLLELTSESSPLLKRLAEEAPGTFQHSIAVANMAAQAAAAVDADPLLTKVCALYHDVGKLKRPHFYTENQHGENPHDEKTPTISALIISSHVKDGAELARDYKLPHRVIDVMSQHHGTTLIQYFYNKQKELTPDSVDESQFRYKSLKPQSKEAAILLMADSVEASSRSLNDLNPDKIKAHVKRIIDHKMKDDNQFEETNLTLKDIDKIEDEFVKVLISANHKRIKYQNQLKEEAAAKAVAAKEEAAATKADIERRVILEEAKMEKSQDNNLSEQATNIEKDKGMDNKPLEPKSE